MARPPEFFQGSGGPINVDRKVIRVRRPDRSVQRITVYGVPTIASQSGISPDTPKIARVSERIRQKLEYKKDPSTSR
jgi:hypothetical protein